MSDQKSPLSVGDSIGLIALIVTILTLVLTPPLWAKASLLLVSGLLLTTTVDKAIWTNSLHPRYRTLLKVVLLMAVGPIGVKQLIQQFRKDHPNSLAKLIAHFSESIVQLWKFPSFRYSLAVLSGCLLTLCVLAVIGVIAARARGQQSASKMSKGFLEYKLQAETALAEIPKALEPLSRAMGDVGPMMESMTEEIKESVQRGTQVHLSLANTTGRKLRSITRRMNAKLARLERVSRSFEEGILGWFDWAHRTGNAQQSLQPFVVPFEQLQRTAISTGAQCTLYIQTLSNIKGVSRMLDEAIDQHIAVIQKINEANLRVNQTCYAGVGLITQQPPQGDVAATLGN